MNIPPMRVVTVGATELVLFQRMMMLQVELQFRHQVTAVTPLRITARIDDLDAVPAPFLHVQATGSVTGLAALAGGTLIITGDGDPRVARHLEIAGDLLVAQGAGFVADILRPGDHRRGQHHPFHGGTRDQEHQAARRDQGQRQQPVAEDPRTPN